MQREIKFRGKRVDNGEWVYGFLFELSYDGSSALCIGIEPLCANDYSEIYKSCYAEVIPETIGQYTGIRDMHGKPIYEGDAIPYHFNHNTVGVVKYGEYHNPFDSDNHGGHVGFYLDWFEPDSLLRADLGYWIKVSEVIGNIHDKEVSE